LISGLGYTDLSLSSKLDRDVEDVSFVFLVPVWLLVSE